MKVEALERYLAPLKRRVLGMVARAVVKAISDEGGLQKIQASLLADELHSNVDRVQEYGFSSVPLPGSEGVFLAVGGSREHGVIVATDDRRYRPKNLQPGEVMLYTDEGNFVKFKRGQKIEVNSQVEVLIKSATKVKVDAPTAEVACTNAVVNASAKAEVTSPTIELTAATTVKATTPIMEVTGLVKCSGIATGGITPIAGKGLFSGDVETTNLKATGNVEDQSGTMQEMRNTYNTHTHPENGTGGGTTSAPNEPMS